MGKSKSFVFRLFGPTNLICFPCSSVLEGVKELYLEAAHQNGDVIDPDLQTGLGVLFHTSGEFNRAIGI